MTYEEVYKAIVGLYAYDDGAVDSGIHDEKLRAKLKAHVRSLNDTETRLLLSKVLVEACLNEEALAQGYGWEDAKGLAEWFSNDFEM